MTINPFLPHTITSCLAYVRETVLTLVIKVVFVNKKVATNVIFVLGIKIEVVHIGVRPRLQRGEGEARTLPGLLAIVLLLSLPTYMPMRGYDGMVRHHAMHRLSTIDATAYSHAERCDKTRYRNV